jgi:hypothetical protein
MDTRQMRPGMTDAWFIFFCAEEITWKKRDIPDIRVEDLYYLEFSGTDM